MFVSLLTGALLLTNIARASNFWYDSYIICHDPLPDGFPPAGYSADQYKHTMDLCSATNGASKNLGCLCPSSNAVLQCHEQIADPVLWSALDPDVEDETLADFCKSACWCSPTRQEQTKPPNAKAQQQQNGPQGSGGSNAPANKQANSGSSTDISTDTSNPPPPQGQCGTQCKTNTDCSVKGADAGCMCLTQSEHYQPGKGTVAFLAACIVSLGGKRDEGRPCPCNGTYVSHGCCGARNGLVWEAKEFKLGELLRGDEL